MCSSLQTFIELPPFPRKVIGKAETTEGIKRVLEPAREIGVQIKLRLREEHCLSVTQYEADTGYAHRSFLHRANLQAMGRRARPVLHRGRRGPVCCGDALGKLQSRKLLSGH